MISKGFYPFPGATLVRVQNSTSGPGRGFHAFSYVSLIRSPRLPQLRVYKPSTVKERQCKTNCQVAGGTPSLFFQPCNRRNSPSAQLATLQDSEIGSSKLSSEERAYHCEFLAYVFENISYLITLNGTAIRLTSSRCCKLFTIRRHQAH